VHLARPAAGILVEGGRCTRVVTEDGAEFAARAVVSNADFRETFGRLLGATGQAALREHADRPRSPSFFIAYAGARLPAPAASSIGSFSTFDLAKLLEPYVPFGDGDPLGVTISSLEDSGLAPPGCHAVSIHELVPQGGWRSEQEKPACLDRLLDKAEAVLPGLRRGLLYAEAATPASLERYTRNLGGAAYGWEQRPALPRIRHGIPNLHLVGHWTETGAGVLAAAFSGLRTAVRLLRATA
jgi:phytoene dehydrogenase-like protein